MLATIDLDPYALRERRENPPQLATIVLLERTQRDAEHLHRRHGHARRERLPLLGRADQHDASIRTIAVQPEDAFHGLEGMKHLPTAIVPKIWDADAADEVWGAPTEGAYDIARALARNEGLLVGHSSGAAMWGVGKLAQTIEQGVVVTVFPDSGDRYLSTGLYGSSTR